MIITEPVDLGPLEATFEADLTRIRSGKIMIVLLAIVFSATCGVMAIYGVPEDARELDPNKTVMSRIMLGAFSVASIALGIHMYRKVSREADSRVNVHEQGMAIDWQGERFRVLWKDILAVKISDGNAWPLILLFGLIWIAFLGLLGGGQRSTLLLTFRDRSRTLLPAYLSRMPELAEIVSVRTNIPIPKLRK